MSASLLTKLLRSGRVEEVWESYGLSEALTHVATRQLSQLSDLHAPFHPLPSVTVGVNEHGCAVLDAPSRGVSQLTTSDCIEELPEGGFVWLGRADEVVNTGGILVHPSEVERAFESFMPSWVSDWAAFGRKDETLGSALVLRLSGTPPEGEDRDALLHAWRERLKDLLGPAKTPRILEWGTSRVPSEANFTDGCWIEVWTSPPACAPLHHARRLLRFQLFQACSCLCHPQRQQGA